MLYPLPFILFSLFIGTAIDDLRSKGVIFDNLHQTSNLHKNCETNALNMCFKLCFHPVVGMYAQQLFGCPQKVRPSTSREGVSRHVEDSPPKFLPTPSHMREPQSQCQYLPQNAGWAPADLNLKRDNRWPHGSRINVAGTEFQTPVSYNPLANR